MGCVYKGRQRQTWVLPEPRPGEKWIGAWFCTATQPFLGPMTWSMMSDKANEGEQTCLSPLPQPVQEIRAWMLHREMPSVLSGSRICCPSTGANLRKETEAGGGQTQKRGTRREWFFMAVGRVQLVSGGRVRRCLPVEVIMEMEAHRSCPEERSEEG